jgi:hypothetical protein
VFPATGGGKWVQKSVWCLCLYRVDTDNFALLLEPHGAAHKSEEGVILATLDVGTRILCGTALTHEDGSGWDGLSVTTFVTEAI